MAYRDLPDKGGGVVGGLSMVKFYDEDIDEEKMCFFTYRFYRQL